MAEIRQFRESAPCRDDDPDIYPLESRGDIRSRKSEAPLQKFPVISRRVAANPAPKPSNAEEVEFAQAPMLQRPKDQKPAAKKWWQKLPWPANARKAKRAVLPGLVAYFFTGGAPTAQRVRDMSTSGLFVLTSERWYRGTFVRMTLTDERKPTAERSITLHAKVIRWTDDGMGLQFVLYKKDERLRGTVSTLDNLPGGSSVKEVKEFIGRFKSSL